MKIISSKIESMDENNKMLVRNVGSPDLLKDNKLESHSPHKINRVDQLIKRNLGSADLLKQSDVEKK